MTIAAKKREAETIRVGIVVASPEIIGGHSVQALRLIDGLKSEPCVRAQMIPINPQLPGALRWLQRIKYVRTLVTTLAFIASLLARVPRLDVLHIFSASYFSFLLAPAPALIIAALFGKRTILNYHSGEAEDHLRRWKSALPIIRLASQVIVPSEYLVQVFAQFGVRAKAIFNTVDTHRFQFRERRRLAPVLLSNRNLESHYNVACSLRAFALVQSRIPEARMIVAGSGSQQAALRELAEELRLKNVEFVGAVAPARMPELYESADIFVNASDIDNMPLSIIEAFACGLAVVTTDAGGIPHMVEHNRNGLVAERGDYQALARHIISLIEDDGLRARLVKAAREDCNRYTWDAVKSLWLASYREAAGQTEPATPALEACK